jgi:hypothetical protein
MLPPTDKFMDPGRLASGARVVLQAFISQEVLQIVRTALAANMMSSRPVIGRRAIVVAGISRGFTPPPMPLAYAVQTERLCSKRKVRQAAAIQSIEAQAKRIQSENDFKLVAAELVLQKAIDGDAAQETIAKHTLAATALRKTSNAADKKLLSDFTRAKFLLDVTTDTLDEANGQIDLLATAPAVTARYPINFTVEPVIFPRTRATANRVTAGVVQNGTENRPVATRAVVEQTEGAQLVDPDTSAGGNAEADDGEMEVQDVESDVESDAEDSSEPEVDVPVDV